MGPSERLLNVACFVSVLEWVIASHLADLKKRIVDIRWRFVSTNWPDDFQTICADVEIPFGSEKWVGQNRKMSHPNWLIEVIAQQGKDHPTK